MMELLWLVQILIILDERFYSVYKRSGNQNNF